MEHEKCPGSKSASRVIEEASKPDSDLYNQPAFLTLNFALSAMMHKCDNECQEPRCDMESINEKRKHIEGLMFKQPDETQPELMPHKISRKEYEDLMAAHDKVDAYISWKDFFRKKTGHNPEEVDIFPDDEVSG